MKKIILITIFLGILSLSSPVLAADTCLRFEYTLDLRSDDETTNGEVSKLQQFLKNQGYFNEDISGYYSKSTAMAVISFQRANGIEISENPWSSAIIGSRTAEKIAQLTCPIQNIKTTVQSQSIWNRFISIFKRDNNVPVVQVSQTATPIPTYTISPSPVYTSTPTPVVTPKTTVTPTYSPTPTYTYTPTPTYTYTQTPTPTYTYTPSPTYTSTPIPTATYTYTPSPSATYTTTPTYTSSPTYSPTPTYTYSPSPTYSSTPTYTSSPTYSPSYTSSPSPSSSSVSQSGAQNISLGAAIWDSITSMFGF